MSNIPRYPSGVYLIDFEYRPANGREGNAPDPVCLVVREWPSGLTRRYWCDELRVMNSAPFPTDASALVVAFYASAEMSCFLALGWTLPTNLLDLFAEFRCFTNGRPVPAGNGLLGALTYFGLDTMSAQEKDEMRELILAGDPWDADQQQAILDYCESDVVALTNLLQAMADGIDWPRARLRGTYMQAVAAMEFRGIPLDTPRLDEVINRWTDIQDELIARIDQSFGVFEGRSFKAARWEQYLAKNDIPWPRLPTGSLDLRKETFKDMARVFLAVAPIHQLRGDLSSLRLSSLTVGDDGRNRCLLSPFRAKTGRNQPSTNRFIYGPSKWMRGFIRPRPGFGLAYVDWAQQEFGIAAALSQDGNMIAAYHSADPYLEFAKQAGAVPLDATKKSHKAERDQFKACVLATQYGMGPESLALRINQSVAQARELLALHRRTYPVFWAWSENVINEAVLRGRLWTTFGWQFHLCERPNDRSLRNFPMQATGAEMMRIACILLVQHGIGLCAPVHDALLIEAPLDELDQTLTTTQALMAEASRIVLNGFELASDAKVIRYPDRYMDDSGVTMWNTVMELIGAETERVGTRNTA